MVTGSVLHLDRNARAFPGGDRLRQSVTETAGACGVSYVERGKVLA